MSSEADHSPCSANVVPSGPWDQESPAHRQISIIGSGNCPRVSVRTLTLSGPATTNLTLTGQNQFRSQFNVIVTDESRSALSEVTVQSVERPTDIYRLKFAYITLDTSHFVDSRTLYGGVLSVADSFGRRADMMKVLGITSGCSPTEFCPLATMRRAQLATFIARLHSGGSVDRTYTPQRVVEFSDIPVGHVHWKHVQYVLEKGLLPVPAYAPGGTYDGEIGFADELAVKALLQRLGLFRRQLDALRCPGGCFPLYSRASVMIWLLMSFLPNFYSI